MRYFFIDRPPEPHSAPQITGSDARHIRRVLRMKAGDPVGLFDGQGTTYDAVIKAISPQGVTVAVLRSYPAVAESSVALTVLQAILKDRKMDGLVRQMTELGVARWVPFLSKRAVPRPNDGQQQRRMQRWSSITHEAAKQSRRGRVIDLRFPVGFDEALSCVADCDVKVMFWEKADEPLRLARPGDGVEKIRTLAVMLGPEGGFTDGEVAAACDAGFQTAGLGPRILRAETAAVASVSLIQYLVGDMGPKSA